MSTTAPEGTPPEGQGQQPPDPTPPAPPPVVPVAVTPVPGSGPWANDLATLIEDEAVRARVDQFMRDRVQPHTTRLEQQIAESKDAVQLWKQLNEDPVNTYVAMTTEMFGEEAGKQLLAQLQAQQGAPPVDPALQSQPATPSLDPRVEEALNYIEAKRNSEAYDAEMAAIKAVNPDLDTSLLDPFVVKAGGDFNQAILLYNEWAAKFNEPSTPETPPAALGSDTNTAAPSSTPTSPRKESLDEAINGFMADQRANREAPPVVG